MDESDMSALFEPGDVREVLAGSFYGKAEKASQTTKKAKPKKPDHYKVICISLYLEDLARLDEKVSELKERGHRKMSRSALIRFALDQVDLDALPKSY